MSTCTHCGGPISFAAGPAKCPFCDAVNEPPPKVVEVAVPVQVVVQSSAPAPIGAAPEMRCPHCKKRLVTVKVEGIALAGCGACGGIWIDNASAKKVLASPMPVFADLARRAAAGASGSRGRAAQPTCPMCPAVLDRARSSGIELDVCPDHGTWFDAYELSSLIAILRNESVAPARPSASAVTIACRGCGRVISSDRANVTDLGLRCDACWRAEQSELIAAADAVTNERGAVTVAGAMLGLAGLMLGAASKR